MAPQKEVAFVVRAKDAFSAVMKQAENSVGGVTKKAFDMKAAFVGLLAGFSVAILVKDLLELGAASDKAMRQMTANLPTGVAGIRQLKAEIKDLAEVSGRSLEEMQNAAVEITRLGVGSASEVSQRLKAATVFADATGNDLTATVQGLDQIMDTFGLNADQAKQTLADLASAAQGRVDVSSLLDAFQKVSPVVHELGLDAKTTTKALVTLLDAGMTAKQAGAFLEKLDRSGVEQLAKQATVAGDSLQQLEDRSKTVTDGIGRHAQSLRSQLSGIGEDLATFLTPPANVVVGWAKWLTGMFAEYDKLAKEAAARRFPGEKPLTAKDLAGEGAPSPTTIPKSTNVILPLTNDQKAAIASVREQLDQLGLATERDIAGATKSAVDDAIVSLKAYGQQMAAERAKIAADKNLPGGNKAADLARLDADFKAGVKLRTDAINALRVKERDEAMQAVGDAFLTVSNDVLGQFDKEAHAKIKALREELTKIPSGLAGDADFAEASAQLSAYTDGLQRLRTATAAVIDANTKEAAIQRMLFDHPDEVQAYTDAVNEYDAILANLRATQAGFTQDSPEWKKVQEEITKALGDQAGAIDVLLKKFPELANAASGGGQVPINKQVRNVKQLVEEWSAVGRSIIAASQALGLMDDKTAATLQNVVSLADGIGRIMSGDVLQGAAESITSVAALVSSITGNGPEEKARQEALKANTLAILKLTEKTGLLNSVNLSGASGSAALTLVNSILKQSEGHLVKAKVNGLTPEQGAMLNEVAKELGITLDDTVGSFVKLQEALATSLDRLGEFGDSFQDILDEMDASKAIFGDQGPQANLTALLQGAGKKSGTFQFLADNADTTTAEGRAALRKWVEETFKQMMNGGGTLDPSALGGLTGSEFLHVLEQIIADLNDMEPAAATAATAIETLNGAMTETDQNIAINDITDPITQFSMRAETYKKAGGALGDFLSQFDLTTADGIAAMDKALPGFLEHLKENPEAFDLAGLSIEELTNILLGLDTAADSVAAGIESAIGKINDATSALSDNFTINDISDPTKQLGATVGAASGKDTGLDAVLQGADTSTAGGRAALKKKLQDFYASHPEFGGIIANIVRQINAIDTVPAGSSTDLTSGGGSPDAGSTSASTSAFQGLTTIQGDQLLDLARRQMTRLDLLVPINTALQTMVTRVALPSAVSFSGALQASGIEINAPISVQVHTAAEDAETQGTLVADAIVRELDAKLGRSTVLQKLLRGNVEVAA